MGRTKKRLNFIGNYFSGNWWKEDWNASAAGLNYALIRYKTVQYRSVSNQRQPDVSLSARAICGADGRATVAGAGSPVRRGVLLGG